jgi:hypothetical protein
VKKANIIEENARPVKNPKVDLEMLYMDEYLYEKGYSIKELDTLPAEQATRLRTEASQYASLKLAELESRARLRARIKSVSDSA